MNAFGQALSKAAPDLVKMSQEKKAQSKLDGLINEGLKGVRYGGMRHRFKNDAAVFAYCLDNSLDSPVVMKDGEVFARDPDGQDRQIGWIC